MSVTHEHFLSSAKEIAASGLDEMSQRNAISRAYYAAYHRSKVAIPPDNLDRNVGSHKSYILQLKEAPNGSENRRLGLKLSSLYAARVDAERTSHRETSRCRLLAWTN